jgi:hypothetical protein
MCPLCISPQVHSISGVSVSIWSAIEFYFLFGAAPIRRQQPVSFINKDYISYKTSSLSKTSGHTFPVVRAVSLAEAVSVA